MEIRIYTPLAARVTILRRKRHERPVTATRVVSVGEESVACGPAGRRELRLLTRQFRLAPVCPGGRDLSSWRRTAR